MPDEDNLNNWSNSPAKGKPGRERGLDMLGVLFLAYAAWRKALIQLEARIATDSEWQPGQKSSQERSEVKSRKDHRLAMYTVREEEGQGELGDFRRTKRSSQIIRTSFLPRNEHTKAGYFLQDER